MSDCQFLYGGWGWGFDISSSVENAIRLLAAGNMNYADLMWMFFVNLSGEKTK